MSKVWPWLILFGLGAYHGINPAMGWLFAVALGLQEKSRRAVLEALPPIALGHVLSIAAVVGVFWLARVSVPQRVLRYGAAAILFGFASYRLIRSRHPTWVGMRVGFRDLTTWSFLMASAHGAGLMLVPILLGWPQSRGADSVAHFSNMPHANHLSFLETSPSDGPLYWSVAVGVHSIGYLCAAVLVALLVYEKLGVAILRRAWFNFDLVWMVALLVSGIVIVLV